MVSETSHVLSIDHTFAPTALSRPYYAYHRHYLSPFCLSILSKNFITKLAVFPPKVLRPYTSTHTRAYGDSEELIFSSALLQVAMSH